MLLWKRQQAPAGFSNRVAPVKRAIREQIRSNRAPSFELELWKEYKFHLTQAQERKCAFCEVLETTYVGAVEHFRPKARVEALRADPETWGAENRHTTNVEGRRPEVVSTTDYWWLAYSWSNWLFACERCNSSWKKGLFPLAAGTERWSHPCPRIRERTLLLDPYGTEDPAGHLTFNEVGQIEPFAGSELGRATIQTLGLDRESLRAKRQEKAWRTLGTIARLVKAYEADDETEIQYCCSDLVELGRKEYEHAGMVRILVKQHLGLSWEFLEENFGEAP